MKNKHALEQWEHFVQEANRPNILKEPWRATSTSRICSHNFQVTDYIIPPSVNGSCRLKKYVIPSKSHDAATMLYTIPNKTRCRLDQPRSQGFSVRTRRDTRKQPRSQGFSVRTRRDTRKPWSGPVT